jgi:hypothetical protein
MFTLTYMGPAVKIHDGPVSDVSRFKDVEMKLSASGGSGSFRFVPLLIPEKLVLTEDGVLKGRPGVPSGVYSMKIRVEDRVFAGISDEKEYEINVVDYYPDEYEKMADDDFKTKNVALPGETVQDHTFNRNGDVDMVRMDLSNVPENHVIQIESIPGERHSDIDFKLYDSKTDLINRNYVKVDGRSLLFFCRGPENPYVFLKTSEINNRTGEYGIKITDIGQRVELASVDIPDALSKGQYSYRLIARGGSGRQVFSSENLPAGLIMDRDGLISGNLGLRPATYPFKVQITDLGYHGITTYVEMALNVVEYFPDTYEEAGDRDFNTHCLLLPDGHTQKHTLHEPDDTDMIRLDLSSISVNDVIRVLFKGKETNGEIVAEFYDTREKIIDTFNRENSMDPLKIVYCCKIPGIYYIKVKQLHKRPGEYEIMADNCGQKIELNESALPDSESSKPYIYSVKATGGQGKYDYQITDGGLPKGLMLDGKTGEIKGKSTSWGGFDVTVTATDRMYPENNGDRRYHINAFIGEKIHGTDRVVFPHYVSGAYSMDTGRITTKAFPGKLDGGIKENLRFVISSHNIPEDRFETVLNERTGELVISEKIPVSCEEYSDMDIFIEMDVTDSLHTNNTFRIRYEIPAKCLKY